MKFVNIVWPIVDSIDWGEPYQGWCNSATWCFALYFGQERQNIEALLALRQGNGDCDRRKVLQLFRDATRKKNGLHMEPLDEWTEGPVNAKEVYEHLTQK